MLLQLHRTTIEVEYWLQAQCIIFNKFKQNAALSEQRITELIKQTYTHYVES